MNGDLSLFSTCLVCLKYPGKCKSSCVPPKDNNLGKIQSLRTKDTVRNKFSCTLGGKEREGRCVLQKCCYKGRHVTLAWQPKYLSQHQSFEFLKLWIWMCQHKHQVCLLQYKVVRRRADHISLGGWYSNTDLVTVSETVQTKADHGRGPQRVQKHVTKRTAILNGSSNKVRISRLAFWVEFLQKLLSLCGV